MYQEELVARHKNAFYMSSLKPRFKQYRKLLNSGLSSRATQTHLPLIGQETRTFLSALATAPENFISHIKRYVQHTQAFRSVSPSQLLTSLTVIREPSSSKLPMVGLLNLTMIPSSLSWKKGLASEERWRNLASGSSRLSRCYVLSQLGCLGQDLSVEPLGPESVCLVLTAFHLIGRRNKLWDHFVPSLAFGFPNYSVLSLPETGRLYWIVHVDGHSSGKW